MKKLLYLLFIFTVLLMSWDFNQENSVIAASDNIIPDESIRLRIIANSDSAEDQWLKRKIRDIVTEEINTWVSSLNDINQARVVIESHLPEIQQIVDDTIEEYGYKYQKESKVELGVVPFPTKMYGEIVYPAGEYEALRITLGAGQGENWWCVLFPPLCFVDMSSGDAVKEAETGSLINQSDANEKENDVEVKFFLAELFAKIGSLF